MKTLLKKIGPEAYFLKNYLDKLLKAILTSCRGPNKKRQVHSRGHA